MPALPSNPVVPRDGTLTITDNTGGTPLSLVIQYEDGDFQVTGVMAGQHQVQEFKDRGEIYAVRKTDQVPVEFSFTAHIVGLTDGTTATPGDVVRQGGVWASAVSQLAAAYGDAYLLKLAWGVERSNFGAAADNSLTMKYCHMQVDAAEGIPGKWSIKGTAYPMAHDANAIVWT